VWGPRSDDSRAQERCRPEASLNHIDCAAAAPAKGKGYTVRSVVLITCPQTGELVPTGVTADVLDELPAVNVLNGCAECGGDHEWRRDEAVITVISES
jgi:hypothetical protein